MTEQKRIENVSELKVEFIDKMGNDLTIVNAARVSFGNTQEELTDKDKKLIKYLADHLHMSPFEHCMMSVKISCPLYIRSQIHRHRTFAYNEISRRYTSKNLQFYSPPNDDIRVQAKKNRQASADAMTPEMSASMDVAIQSIHQKTLDTYNLLLEQGVCREQARGILPQNLMTEFYMTGNLRNWMHFVNLRLHEGAQKEAQYIANQCLDLLLANFPVGAKAIRDTQLKMGLAEWVDKFFSNSNIDPDKLEQAYEMLAGKH